MRILIVGTGGSGKTWMGKFLSKKLQIPYVDLDDLYWLPNWTKRSPEEFQALIQKTVEKPSWILSGNQSKYRPLFLPKADLVIWLDLPLYLLLYRVFKRSFKTLFTQEKICNGNRQTLSQFIWIIKWTFFTFRRRKKEYNQLAKNAKKQKWIHLQSKKAVDQFLAQSF